MLKSVKPLLLSALLVLLVAGCSSREAPSETASLESESHALPQTSSLVVSTPSDSSEVLVSSAPIVSEREASAPASDPPATDPPAASEPTAVSPAASEDVLTVHFGDNGAPFTMHLYDNATAAAIAGYVGTADWRLPIYEYDGYDNWEVMQFYDLPSRYEIPAAPETVTTEKTGEVYYSDPNRIVLFYGDAEVTGEYTRVGYFDATEEFVTAVSGNPVLEGWGNKIVLIKD